MSATPELAVLKGARAVMTSEIDEGSFLSEALIKLMTGDDPISARANYGDPFEFVPRFKLFMAGNHKPVIRGGDEGIWRRIDLIPFEVTIPPAQRDPELAEKLRAELPGILNWTLEGCLAWQKRRLDSPPAVVNAVAEYKEDMDILGQWLAAKCEIGPELTVAGADAYSSYKFWAECSGLRARSQPIFGRKLKERFASVRESGGVRYLGVRDRVYRPVVSAIPKTKVVPTPPAKPV